MPTELKPWIPQGLTVDFVHQTLPQGAKKPLGTAMQCSSLEAHPEWQGLSVAVFNGDNLPPEGACRCCIKRHRAWWLLAERWVPEGRERLRGA